MKMPLFACCQAIVKRVVGRAPWQRLREELEPAVAIAAIAGVPLKWQSVGKIWENDDRQIDHGIRGVLFSVKLKWKLLPKD